MAALGPLTLSLAAVLPTSVEQSMPKRKRQAKKKLAGKGRLNDAKRWLQSCAAPKNLTGAYSKRYAVSEPTARDELITIGCHDDIMIQEYEKQGVKWEYMVEPMSGEMYVVPKGTEEYELYSVI
jgi:hypothetical protein